MSPPLKVQESTYILFTCDQRIYQKTFLRKTSKCLIFENVSKSRTFFENPALSLFYLYSPLTSCKKSENPFWKNWVTNQPIITNNTDLIVNPYIITCDQRIYQKAFLNWSCQFLTFLNIFFNSKLIDVVNDYHMMSIMMSIMIDWKTVSKVTDL